MSGYPTPDVVIIGAGAAGRSAALVLGRARRDVLLVDAAEQANLASVGIGGLLGHDGRSPAELYAISDEELARYPSIRRVPGRVSSIEPCDTTRWHVHIEPSDDSADEAGPTGAHTDHVLMTTGMIYEVPDIPGAREGWGDWVFHCPFCHGWEHHGQEWVVVGADPTGAHRATLATNWTDRVTFVSHGHLPAPEQLADLERRGVRVVDAAVRKIGHGEVLLDDGTTPAAGGVLVSAPHRLTDPSLLSGVGLELDDTGHLAITPFGQTGVDGIWAAGDLTSAFASVARVAGEGMTVGASMVGALTAERTGGTFAPPGSSATAVADEAAEWDERYGERDAVWSGKVNGSLAAEVGDLSPGRALDVGCGEGADAAWLADHGWQVVAIDPSRVALERAQRAASGRGITWVRGGIDDVLPGEGFDLVTAQYPAILKSTHPEAIERLLAAVAPRGTLLVVHHAMTTHEHDGEEHAFDPSDYVLPADVHEVVAGHPDWEVDLFTERDRLDAPPESRHARDTVLVAKRV